MDTQTTQQQTVTSAFTENRSHYDPSPSPPPPAVTAAGGFGEPRAGPATTEATMAANVADNASSIDHVEEKVAPGEVLSRRQKARRHCARFWLWYLIAAIILLAILLPVL